MSELILLFLILYFSGNDRFIGTVGKIPLKELNVEGPYEKRRWHLPKNYNFYYLEGKYLEAFDHEDGTPYFIFEVQALGGERVCITKKQALKYEDFNFNNYVKLTFEDASNEKFFDNSEFVKTPKEFAYLAKNIGDEECFPADVDRRDIPIHADVDRQENHLIAETDRQKLAENFENYEEDYFINNDGFEFEEGHNIVDEDYQLLNIKNAL